MWYKIPTSLDNIYKGWQIEIYPASNWNKKLKVTISPAVELDFSKTPDISAMEKMKLFFELENKLKHYKSSFEVQQRYLGILEFAEPWGKAMEEAKQFIDRKGPFDLNSFINEQ